MIRRPAPTARALTSGLYVAVLAAAGALPLAAAAQETPPAAAACMAVSVDAERLRCYDAAFRRVGLDPQVADTDAVVAQAVKEAVTEERRAGRSELPRRERARLALSDVFASEGGNELDDRIANAGRGGLLDRRWELAKDSKLGTFNFRAYKPVYLLPVFWNADPNRVPTSSDTGQPVEQPLPVDDLEAKFQISFKTKLAQNLFGDNGDVWMGFTQSSRWQIYSPGISRPFRETNYEPEAMLVFRTGYSLGGWRGRMAGIGINHQSNGRADPFSRSWNRIVGTVGLDRENWAVTLRPWWRVGDSDGGDNPDIENYMGRGDVTIVHTRGQNEFSLMARHSLRTGEDSRGALQFDWGFPISGALRGHLQVFDGYGESLIDHDHRSTHVGIGISMLEWF